MSVKCYDLIRLKEVIPDNLSVFNNNNQELKLNVIRVESKLKVSVILMKDIV